MIYRIPTLADYRKSIHASARAFEVELRQIMFSRSKRRLVEDEKTLAAELPVSPCDTSPAKPQPSPEYPAWICGPCGEQLGSRTPVAATWHYGPCGWCGSEDVPVTEPRDYGYPPPPGVAVTRVTDRPEPSPEQSK